MYNKNIMDLIINKSELESNDIPVWAAIVKDDNILSLQTNKKEERNDATAHAEILAIREASQIIGNWRLKDCDMYVTLEPCPMCMWAIISARIKNLYFGSFDSKFGSISCGLNLETLAASSINIEGGKQESRCDYILKKYFKRLRDEKKT